ncbi:ycf2-A Protein [Nymphaea thermarum]|nr:ycf2-A Protein [Nymphaea thermarum]
MMGNRPLAMVRQRLATDNQQQLVFRFLYSLPLVDQRLARTSGNWQLVTVRFGLLDYGVLMAIYLIVLKGPINWDFPIGLSFRDKRIIYDKEDKLQKNDLKFLQSGTV